RARASAHAELDARPHPSRSGLPHRGASRKSRGPSRVRHHGHLGQHRGPRRRRAPDRARASRARPRRPGFGSDRLLPSAPLDNHPLAMLFDYRDWQPASRLTSLQERQFARPPAKMQWWYFDALMSDGGVLVVAFVPRKWWREAPGAKLDDAF